MATQLPPLRIFCGYAHADQALFRQLKTALAILIRQEVVIIWHDGGLLPGDQWEYEIERELNTADIILLLVSPTFIASDYCWGKEMRWAITRHSLGEAHVIPILLKPTPGWETTPLGALQALPTMAKPIRLLLSRKLPMLEHRPGGPGRSGTHPPQKAGASSGRYRKESNEDRAPRPLF